VEVLKHLAKEGLLNPLISSGAVLGTPGCGTCFGAHGWLLSDKEICISTITSNLPGRMGSPKAKVYLGSPATVAASAVEGMLADPRAYL
jgi:homoaconitase/3-isopropylmalate dehydratase large subunit